MPLVLLVGAALVAAALFAAGFLVSQRLADSRVVQAEAEIRQVREQAEQEAERARREALVAAKEESLRLRGDLEREFRDQRRELQSVERRLLQKEEALERRGDSLERREESGRRQEQELATRQQAIEELYQRQLAELERIAGWSAQEAKEALLNRVAAESQAEAAEVSRRVLSEARENAEREARNVIAMAMQRCASDFVTEATVSVVNLPNDEMKGRIIGREGRNIRALENLTGVNLIIDDTPEAVIVSAFDPVRREVARLALERLIADGRIHPARIEEMVEKAEHEVDNRVREEGERAALETGVHGLHPEMVKTLGRLYFRFSYGQNVLRHSVEVSHLAAAITAELGGNVAVARRAGLIHDVGKAADHQMEGTHVNIGMELARKYREPEDIIDAFAAHHGEYEAKTIEAFAVATADAISAARPGARRESVEAYVKRLQQLEDVANSFAGVQKSYAIQAGREIRIMVRPEELTDHAASQLARDVVKKIEQELQYPGQIKVTVIRETRAVEYASNRQGGGALIGAQRRS